MARVDVGRPSDGYEATLERMEVALLNARADVESIRGRLLRLAFNPRDPAVQWCEEIASAVDHLLGPAPDQATPRL